MRLPLHIPYLGTHLPFAKRIQRAAFAQTMRIVLVIGSTSLSLTFFEIPVGERKVHRNTLKIIAGQLNSDLKHAHASMLELSRSTLV